MSLFNLFKKGNERKFDLPLVPVEDCKEAWSLVDQYSQFYEKHAEEDLCKFGLMRPMSTTVFHDVALPDAIHYLFPFSEACDYSTLSENEENLAANRTAYGNMPIGYEGCLTFWILILNGAHAGEVWLLTDLGITPVGENLTLDKWYEKMTTEGPNFWYSAVEEWGNEKNDFFYAHAPVKHVCRNAENGVQNITMKNSQPVCQSCLNIIALLAKEDNLTVHAINPWSTYLFGTTPPADEENQWYYARLSEKIAYYHQPTSEENKQILNDLFNQ